MSPGPGVAHGVSTGANHARRDVILHERNTRPRQGSAPPQWQPWEAMIAEGQTRMHLETREATQAYEARIREAGKMLDRADSMAREARGGLESQAWAIWHKLMEDAAQAADAVMRPALDAYKAELDRAHDDFERMMTIAADAWRRQQGDAERAKRDNRVQENLALPGQLPPAPHPGPQIVPPLT